jgi:hypothetical protein
MVQAVDTIWVVWPVRRFCTDRYLEVFARSRCAADSLPATDVCADWMVVSTSEIWAFSMVFWSPSANSWVDDLADRNSRIRAVMAEAARVSQKTTGTRLSRSSRRPG